MEDVVDSQRRLATKGVHPAASAILETVRQLALQRVVDVRVGDIHAVACQNDRIFAIAHVHGEDISLSRTLDHTHGITAIDSLQQAVTLYIIAVFLHLVGAIVHVVGTCRLQVYVVDAEHLSVDIDVYVHCSIGAGRKLDGFAVLDGIAAIDSIMSVQAIGHVGEIFLIAL